jgi:hypothetical protein
MRRAKGRDIVTGAAPPPKRGQVIDIMEALKRSMECLPAKKKPRTTAVAKRKKTVSKSLNCRHRVPRLGGIDTSSLLSEQFPDRRCGITAQ